MTYNRLLATYSSVLTIVNNIGNTKDFLETVFEFLFVFETFRKLVLLLAYIEIFIIYII